MSNEMKRMTIAQERGPAFRFVGRRILLAEWENAAQFHVEHTAQVWETEGGAYVASFKTTDNEGRRVMAIAIPPGDETAMRVAVLDFFEWHPRVRQAAKDKGWSFLVEVA